MKSEQLEKMRELLNRQFVSANGGVSSIVLKLDGKSFIAYTTRKLEKKKVDAIREAASPFKVEFRPKN